jgi:hypothetical protein
MPQFRDEAGNIWDVDAQGDRRFVGRENAPARGGVFTLPQDPAKAATTQGNEIENSIKGATAADLIAKAAADRRKAEADARKAEEDLARGGLTPDQVAERQGKITQFNSLVAQINRVQELFNQGVGQTKGINSVLDYLPSDNNAAFDAAGAALSQQGLGAFRIPGTGTVSDRDAMMFDRANLPTADTRDAAIEEQLRGLRSRLEQEYASRGLPSPQWSGLETGQDNRDAPPVLQAANGGGNPPRTPFDQSGPDLRSVATGGSKTVSDPTTAAALNAMFAAGATLEQINQFAVSRGGAPIDASSFAAVKDYAAKRPGSEPFTATRSESTTAREQFSATPLASGAAGFANTMSMGGVQALAPDDFAASQNLNPVSGIVGGALGTLAPTAAIGAIGRNTVGRVVPRLMAGSGRAQFGRNLATDAAYGAGYGAITEGDPVTGALAAGVGSAAGQGLGSVLGRAVGGITQTAPAKYLADRGIAMTTGQRIGGLAKALEDKAMSLPGVGDLIKSRRVDAFNDFNRTAMNEAGAPIGATTQNVGMQGVQDILDATGTAYDNATAGVTVPLDDQFTQGMNAARQAVQRLPPDLQVKADAAFRNRIDPIGTGPSGPNMTGEAYQQAIRGMKGYKAELTKPGFEEDYRGVLQQGIDTLTDQMKRGGGDQVVQGLEKANAVYRNAKTLEKAVGAAKNGTGSGDIQVFTPAQLNTASYQTAAKFPGKRPFADLADAGQQALPSQIPNSGTADRLLSFALPASLGGASIGADLIGWDKTGAALGLLGALAAGGTKTGQAAINKALFDRPDSLSQVGALIRKYKGLLGTASIPLALESGN